MVLKEATIFKTFKIAPNATNTGVTFSMNSPQKIKIKNDNFAQQVEILDANLDLFDYKYITFDGKAFFEITDTVANENYTTLFVQYVSTLKNGFDKTENDFAVESITVTELTKIGLSLNDVIGIFDERLDIKELNEQAITSDDGAFCYAVKIRLSDIPSNSFFRYNNDFKGISAVSRDILRNKKTKMVNQSYNKYIVNSPIKDNNLNQFDFTYNFFLIVPTFNTVSFEADGAQFAQYNLYDFLKTLTALLSDLTISLELTILNKNSLLTTNITNTGFIYTIPLELGRADSVKNDLFSPHAQIGSQMWADVNIVGGGTHRIFCTLAVKGGQYGYPASQIVNANFSSTLDLVAGTYRLKMLNGLGIEDNAGIGVYDIIGSGYGNWRIEFTITISKTGSVIVDGYNSVDIGINSVNFIKPKHDVIAQNLITINNVYTAQKICPIIFAGSIEYDTQNINNNAVAGIVECLSFYKLKVKTDANRIYLLLKIFSNTVDLSQLKKDYVIIKRFSQYIRIYLDYENNIFEDITTVIEYTQDAFSNYQAYIKGNMALAQEQERNALIQQQKQAKEINRFDRTSGLLRGGLIGGLFSGSVKGAVAGAVGGITDAYISEKKLNIQQQNDIANLRLQQQYKNEYAAKSISTTSEKSGDISFTDFINAVVDFSSIYDVVYIDIDTDTKRDLIYNYIIENGIVEKIYDIKQIKAPSYSGKTYYNVVIRNRSRINNRKGFVIYAE